MLCKLTTRNFAFAIERFWYPQGQCYVLNEGYAHETETGWLWLIRWLAADGTPLEYSDLVPLSELLPIYER